jgi:Uma2 family endonuclease
MRMPASARHRWTRAEVVALIDALPGSTPRYELVDGELLVTPSPSGLHQAGVFELAKSLNEYLRRTGVGEAFLSPFDVELDPGSLVQPDVFVVPNDEAARIRRESPARRLLLAAEVLSPGSARADRGEKREMYQRHVPEYWIIDLEAELFERWRPGESRPEVLRVSLEWHPAGAAEPFVLEVPPWFARVAGGQ